MLYFPALRGTRVPLGHESITCLDSNQNQANYEKQFIESRTVKLKALFGFLNLLNFCLEIYEKKK